MHVCSYKREKVCIYIYKLPESLHPSTASSLTTITEFFEFNPMKSLSISKLNENPKIKQTRLKF